MSIRRCIQLGPYVQCTYRKETREDTVFGCTNTGCTKHPKRVRPDADGKFCSACGGPNGKVTFTVASRTSHYDVVGDELYEINTEGERGNTLYLAANVKRKGDPRPHLDGDHYLHIDLTNVDMAAEITWFTKAFAQELKKLEAAYDNVVVKWGFHQYFN